MITRWMKRISHDYKANIKGNTTLLILFLISGVLVTMVLSFLTQSDFEKEMIRQNPVVITIKNDNIFGNLSEIPEMADTDPEGYAEYLNAYLAMLDRLDASESVWDGTYHLTTVLEYRNIPITLIGIDKADRLEEYSIQTDSQAEKGMLLRENVFSQEYDDSLLPPVGESMNFTYQGEDVFGLEVTDYYTLSNIFDTNMGKGEVINVSSDAILENRSLYEQMDEADKLFLLRVNQAEFRITDMQNVQKFEKEIGQEIESLKKYAGKNGCPDANLTYEVSDNSSLYSQIAKTRLFYVSIFFVMIVNLMVIIRQFMNYLLLSRKKEMVIYLSLGRTALSLSRHYILYYGLIGLLAAWITPLAGTALASVLNNYIAKQNAEILSRLDAYVTTYSASAQKVDFLSLFGMSLIIFAVILLIITVCISAYVNAIHRKNMKDVLRG